MKAMKQGKLRSGSGQKVTNPKQAIAIGTVRRRRKAGKKVPALSQGAADGYFLSELDAAGAAGAGAAGVLDAGAESLLFDAAAAATEGTDESLESLLPSLLDDEGLALP